MKSSSERKSGLREKFIVWEREQQERFPEKDYMRLMVAIQIFVIGFILGIYAIATNSHRNIIFNAIVVAFIFAQGLIGASVSLKHPKRWALGLTIASLIAWFLSIWPSFYS